jgi:hypothetical protein
VNNIVLADKQLEIDETCNSQSLYANGKMTVIKKTKHKTVNIAELASNNIHFDSVEPSTIAIKCAEHKCWHTKGTRDFSSTTGDVTHSESGAAYEEDSMRNDVPIEEQVGERVANALSHLITIKGDKEVPDPF